MNSCSDIDEQVNALDLVTSATNHRLTAEQATQNALNFIGQYTTTTRAEQSFFKVDDVKAISMDKMQTRTDGYSINLDSLFYVVSFADNRGFVIASSDDRETPVIAYVEEGTFEECDTLNHGYEAFVDALIEKETTFRVLQLEQREDDNDEPGPGGGGGGSNYKPDMFEVMYPLLKTKWDQTTFNSYCPGQYTGCVVTAIS